VLPRRPTARQAVRGDAILRGVTLGGIAFSADDARAMVARGYRFIVLGSDAGLVAGAAQRMVQTIRA
jgi:2-keto-3-deoxy-L-rhamnonate aldolase RhmA